MENEFSINMLKTIWQSSDEKVKHRGLSLELDKLKKSANSLHSLNRQF